MKIRTLAAVPVLLVLLVATLACGDGPTKPAGSGTPGTPVADRTPVPGATATQPSIPADFGPAPTLGGNVKTISPAHAALVKQTATRSPDPGTPQGLCAEVSFDGLPENAQWFRIAFDGAEVTTRLVWIVASKVDPKGGRVCYAPTEGFTVGKHSAALSVQDPRNPSAAAKQVIGWAFEVTP